MLLFFCRNHVCYFFIFFETDLWKTSPAKIYKKRHLYFLAKFNHVGEGMRLLSPVRCFVLCFSLGWTEIPARLILTPCKSDGLHANYSELDWNLGRRPGDVCKDLDVIFFISVVFVRVFV
jgi:hypothetical protein